MARCCLNLKSTSLHDDRRVLFQIEVDPIFYPLMIKTKCGLKFDLQWTLLVRYLLTQLFVATNR
jgi:hypothetical protein